MRPKDGGIKHGNLLAAVLGISDGQYGYHIFKDIAVLG